MTGTRWVVIPPEGLDRTTGTGIASWVHLEDVDEPGRDPSAAATATADLDLTLPMLGLLGHDEVRVRPIRLLVESGRVVSAGGVPAVAERLTAVAGRASGTDPALDTASSAVRVVAEVVTDAGARVVAALTEAVESVELDLLGDHADGTVRRLHLLSRQVLRARRALVADREALGDAASGAGSRLDTLVADASDLGTALSTALQVALAEASVRQNDDMRTISAWAAVWAGPTLVAGVYGMNFRHIPELGWAVGYPAALLLMAGLAWAARKAFRRSGWM